MPFSRGYPLSAVLNQCLRLREGNKSPHLSTNAFTHKAHYEAERANVPVKRLDLDALPLLIETHYDHFDTEARALLPLTRIYWPAD